MAEAMLPHLDLLQLTWNQMTNTMVTYVGRGISIDLDQIVNIQTGTKKWSEAEIISLLLEKNISLYRGSVGSKFHNARGGQGAVEFKDDPADIKMNNLLGTFVQQLNILKEISGLNSLDTGGAPTADVGLGIAQMAMQGTDNMLDSVQFADRKVFEATCEHLMYDIQTYGAAGKYKNKPFRITPELHSSKIYNLTVEAVPGEIEKQQLYERVSRYAEATGDEFLLMEVQQCATLAQARLIFAAKQKRAKLEKQQADQANVDYAAEQQNSSAQNKAQLDQMLQKQKDQSAMMELAVKGQIDLTSKIVIEAMKLGKSVEEIEKLVSLANFSPKVIPLPIESSEQPQDQELQQA
jgi:hypothetical protein